MTCVNEVVDLVIEDGVAVVTIDSPPVNALSPTMTDGLYEAIVAALDNPAARAIVLICAGQTFIAGADLKSMGKVTPKVDFFDLQDRIENSSKPTIAALHGTALGGGLETALTFHYRIAVPSARMGLPEVKLGLLPGGGGTQRLPHVVGAERALDMMISGRQVNAQEALSMGLIDRLAPEGQLRTNATRFARELATAGHPPKRIRDLDDKLAADRNDPALFDRFRAANILQFEGLDAPQAILRCVKAAVERSFEEGLRVEREEFQKVLNGPQSAALRHVFMAERAAQKVPGIAKDVQTLPIAKIGIVGAGQMGTGIALSLLDAGFPVALIDKSADAVSKATTDLREVFNSRVERGKLTPDKCEARQLALTSSTQLSALFDADLIIEAVSENIDVKIALMGELAAMAKPSAILATNTSGLNVDAIAAATGHPGRVLGLHFFAPANVMRLVEVVRAAQTEPVVLATAIQLAKKLGKAPVVSGVCPGFIGNRMLAVQLHAAQALLMKGVHPLAIDQAAREFGFAMGPFATMDLIGLDLPWEGNNSPLIAKLVEAGRKGQTSKAGFFDYDGRSALPSMNADEIIAGIAPVAPGSAVMTPEEILDRLTMPIINEGAKILEEGIAYRGSDIDLVWVTGFAWPAHRGGPMWYADNIGLPGVISKLAAFGAGTPTKLLTELSAAGNPIAAYTRV